ncbi:flavin-dependent dehydrogenase [Bradyrhizobium japonicum]
MSTEELPPRESMEFDVVIVGAGPSGLAAAIRLKQLNADLNVVVVEKGSEVGAHILSGAVIDPAGLDKLIPDWREDSDCPLKTQVKDDRFYWMTGGGAIKLPNFIMPPLMDNHHCYIGSLGNVCRWLARKAEALGVEIYPGFAAAEVLYDEQGAVKGIATGDMGIGRDGKPKDSFTRGMELLGKYTLFAEGARGSLTKQLIAKFALDSKSEPPKFGIGLKEVWQIDPAKHQKGMIQHSFGWPLDLKTGGGSFLYHYDDNLVAVGFVVHLNYDDPYLSPFDEFQRFKTHPSIRGTFEGAKRLAYGARAITEGGYQSVPKLSFPGGALVGCAAGFVNVPRIKGVHNAMGTGMLAAEHVAAALAADRAPMTRSSTTRTPGGPRRSARICSWSATSSRCGRSSAPCSASRSAASTCGATRCSAPRCSARSRMRSPIAPPSIRRRATRRRTTRSRTARSRSTSSPRSSCPTLIMRRTSRSISRSPT